MHTPDIKQHRQLLTAVLSLGADRACVVPVSQIRFDPTFRQLCQQNSCGKYGRNWTCPPDVGDIDQLIAQAKQHPFALVFQIVRSLEDSYDFEGMMAAAEQLGELLQQVRRELQHFFHTALYLGGGACPICSRCAKLDDLPCRFPTEAIPSLESYGIHVSHLAKVCDMPYISGANTVTYFAAVLFD